MKIPASEKIVVTYLCEGVERYKGTYNATKNKYILYKIIDGDYQRLKTADTPIEFDKIIEKDKGE